MTEQEKLELYQQLVDDGLSDYEARGTAWPDEDPEDPELAVAKVSLERLFTAENE